MTRDGWAGRAREMIGFSCGLYATRHPAICHVPSSRARPAICTCVSGFRVLATPPLELRCTPCGISTAVSFLILFVILGLAAAAWWAGSRTKSNTPHSYKDISDYK